MLRTLCRRSGVLLIALCGPASSVAAQVASTEPGGIGTVSGAVLAAGGRPLEGAQVFVPGTPIGTLTNASGGFLLFDVPSGSRELRVVRIGYRETSLSIDVPAAGSIEITVSLVEAPIRLDEVVVTGTGAATRRGRLGHTVAVVSTTGLEDAPISTFSELLQGREPGVVALTSDGAVGSGTRLRIRGSNSVSMLNEPLVYVDGIRLDNSGDMGRGGRGGAQGSPLDDLDPGSIERVEILKGPAAATLYGSEASSGVIQVFTKRGGAGRTSATVDLRYGQSRFPDRFGAQAGFAVDAESAGALTELHGIPVEPFGVFERNYVPDLLETGQEVQVGASASGGGESTQYFVSGRFQDEDGPLGATALGNTRDRLRRGQGQASLRFLPSDATSLRLVMSYGVTRVESFIRNNDTGGPLFAAWSANPAGGSCGASGVDAGRPIGDETPRCAGPGNPWGALVFGTPRELLQREVEQERRHFTGSLQGSWAISERFSTDLVVGLDQVDERLHNAMPYGWRVDGVAQLGPPETGALNRLDRSNAEASLDGRLTWASALGAEFEATVTTGLQAYTSDQEAVQVVAWDFPAAGVDDPGLATNRDATSAERLERGAGAFLQGQVGYGDWLFTTLGLRYDRTSAFGSEASGELYPKAGVSAVLSELDGWPSGSIPTLRLRAAVGQSGLQPGAYDKLTTYTSGQGPSGPVIIPGNPGNPDLRPERALEYEFGVEAEVFGGALGVGVTYWDRSTTDALIARPFPSAGGFLEAPLVNIGRLDARGVELEARGTLGDGAPVAVSWFANAAYLRERVTDLGGAPPIRASGSYARHRNQLVEGFAPGAYFGARIVPECRTGLSRTCWEPGVTVPYDLDRDGAPDAVGAFMAFLQSQDGMSVNQLAPMLDDEDGDGDVYDHYLGKPVPDWQGSFGAEFSLWGRLSVNTLFEYRLGNYHAANLTGAFRNAFFRNSRPFAEVESVLQNPDTRADGEARLGAAMRWAQELVSLNPYSGVNLVESADMLRWREVSVTFRPPPAWFAWSGASTAAITLSGRNLSVFTPYSGVDPEANELSRCGGGGEAPDSVQCNFLEATEMFTLPLPRSLSLALRFTF